MPDNIVIYNDTGLPIQVIDGPPPADQSALVADLQAQVTALTGKIAAASTDADKVKADLS